MYDIYSTLFPSIYDKFNLVKVPKINVLSFAAGDWNFLKIIKLVF